MDDTWVLQRLLATDIDLSLAEPAKLLGKIERNTVLVQPWAQEEGFITEGLEAWGALLRPHLKPQATTIALDLGWRRAATWVDDAGRFGILTAPNFSGIESLPKEQQHPRRLETTAANLFRLGQLARSYRQVIVEDINYHEWTKAWQLRAITDAGWRVVRPFLTLDALYRGYRMLLRPSFNSSTRCPRCQGFNQRSFPRELYRCAQCGLMLDVDLLAASNLMLRYLSPRQHVA